jgi:hypothetical protein
VDGELRAIEGPETDAAEKAWLMTTASKIIRNFYRDSVSLMQLSSRLARLAGVNQASAIMASDANLGLLREAKLLVGAGVTRAPLDCFADAVAALAADLPVDQGG